MFKSTLSVYFRTEDWFIRPLEERLRLDWTALAGLLLERCLELRLGTRLTLGLALPPFLTSLLASMNYSFDCFLDWSH